MIELLLASVIVGTVEIAPNVIQVDYLTPDDSIVTVLDNVKSNKQTGPLKVHQ
jgi:hypothetical protein